MKYFFPQALSFGFKLNVDFVNKGEHDMGYKEFNETSSFNLLLDTVTNL